jgi:hypothetical protein
MPLSQEEITVISRDVVRSFSRPLDLIGVSEPIHPLSDTGPRVPLGPIVILSKFVLGVVGPIALGAFTWRKSQSLGWRLFAVYLMTLGD